MAHLLNGTLTHAGAARLGVEPGPVQYKPSFGDTIASVVIRDGEIIAGLVAIGPDGIEPEPTPEPTED